MKYIWQHPDWPCFTYDDTQCRDALYQYALEAGRLSGGMGQLKDAIQYEAYKWIEDKLLELATIFAGKAAHTGRAGELSSLNMV